METASPPTFYVPQDDIDWDLLVSTDGASVCEWKGAAVYWVLASSPDEPVEPQPGRFYGGWITPEVLGPFKGEPGTGHW